MNLPPLERDAGHCLGTPLFRVSREAGRRLFVCSDLHLSPLEPDKTRSFRDFLEGLPSDSTLLILGDLFDYWVGPRQLRQEAWTEFVRTLRTHADRGIQIYCLHGNRDFQLEGRFETASGVRVVPGGLRLLQSGMGETLFLHGDEICRNDLGYQRFKKRIRSAPLRTLVRLLPFRLAERLAGGARRKSEQVVSDATMQDLLPSRGALMDLYEQGHQRVLFGHIHIACHGKLSAGAGSFFVLPSFEANVAGHVCLDEDDGYCLWQGGVRVAWPEAPDFGP